jgi:hypothetical protein
MSVPAHLCALPDDVSRALAALISLSRLLVLRQCSQRLEGVLRRQLYRRLEDLFILAHSSGDHLPKLSTFQSPILLRDLEPLFRKPNAEFFGMAIHYFVEAPNNYFGTIYLQEVSLPVRTYTSPGPQRFCMISGTIMMQSRFLSWLQRRQAQFEQSTAP